LTKNQIAGYLKKGKRFDERELLEYRPIKIEYGVSNKAEGSASIKIGQTEVYAGVKLDVIEPYTNAEEEGTMMVTVELLPLASEKFQSGPPSIQAIELARIVDRGIRESGMIDFKKLCIKEGEKVWSVMIDLYPINDDGNLIDACALAAVAALKNAVMPKLTENNKVDYGNRTSKKLPLTEIIPLTTTFYKIGDSIILDPDSREEEAIEGRISIAVSTDKKENMVNAIQKGEEAAFTKEEIFYILENAVKEREKLFKSVKEELEK